MIMEGAPRRTSPTESTSSSSSQETRSNRVTESGSGFLHNFALSAAVILFIALLLRRLFLLEPDIPEELEDILN